VVMAPAAVARRGQGLARAQPAGSKTPTGAAAYPHVLRARRQSWKARFPRQTPQAARIHVHPVPREGCALAPPKSTPSRASGSPTGAGLGVLGAQPSSTPPPCTSVSRRATARGAPTPPATQGTTARCAPRALRAGRWLRGHAWSAGVAQEAQRCGPCSWPWSFAVAPASRVASFAPARTNP
jgi:hypothetical protein